MRAFRFVGVLALLLTSILTIGTSADARNGPPNRTVYAWFPARFGNFDTRALDWTVLTHLSVRSVVLQPDGTLREPVGRDQVSGPNGTAACGV